MTGPITSINVFVAGIPQPKGSHRTFIPRGCRRSVVTNDNKQTRPWQDTVGIGLLPHRPRQLWTGPILVYLRFHLPRPKSLPSKVQHLIRKPDLDKLTRTILDAMKGIIYKDDAQVCQSNEEKCYATRPGVHIHVKRLE